MTLFFSCYFTILSSSLNLLFYLWYVLVWVSWINLVWDFLHSECGNLFFLQVQEFSSHNFINYIFYSFPSVLSPYSLQWKYEYAWCYPRGPLNCSFFYNLLSFFAVLSGWFPLFYLAYFLCILFYQSFCWWFLLVCFHFSYCILKFWLVLFYIS